MYEGHRRYRFCIKKVLISIDFYASGRRAKLTLTLQDGSLVTREIPVRASFFESFGNYKFCYFPK